MIDINEFDFAIQCHLRDEMFWDPGLMKFTISLKN
jgi:hypothetical protein